MVTLATLLTRFKPRTAGQQRRPLTLLLFALMSLLLLGGAGCAGGPFAPQIPVADTPEKAFADGKEKQDAAQKAEDASRRDDAAKLWGESAAYYQAVSNKFNGSENGLRAAVFQTESLEKQADVQAAPGAAKNYTAAQTTLRKALRAYTAFTFGDGPQVQQIRAARAEAQAKYDDLVARMDTENAKSVYYKVMDTLVHLLGNDSRVAPILAILVIAIVVNLVTWPLVRKQMASAKEFSRYQPELKKLQDKYKGDPQEAFAQQQTFMKTHGINQFAGCLPALAQWPVTLLMYYVIVYYQFHFRNTHFLWVNPAAGAAAMSWPGPLNSIIGHNLSEQDMPLLVLYAASMWVQAKLTPITPNADPAVIEQQKMMASFMPIILFVTMLSWQPPAAFVLYWILSIALGAARYWFINRSLPQLAPLVLNADGSAAAGGDDLTKPMTANPKLVSPKNRQAKRK